MNLTNHQARSFSRARAVLWDMDGTLIDSTEFHWLAWRDTLLLEGYEVTPDQFTATFGWRNEDILRHLFDPNIPPADIARISYSKEERYREFIRTRGIDLLPGAGTWLTHLQTAGWHQALATSAPKLNVEIIFSVLGLGDTFEAIVCAEDIQRGKPNPQIFQVAAARLNVPPDHCLVVEDSPAGLEGAHRAGMKTIGVLNTHPQLDAGVIVQSLQDLTWEMIEDVMRNA